MATFKEDIKIADKGLTVGANAAPDASAVVDLRSTTKGMLSPRMTTAQREAISSPAEGLEVFDTDLNCKFQYTGSAWEKLSTKTELDAHIASSTAHTAAKIVNVPTGDLAATTVQAALDELQTDVNTRATSAALSSHTGASTGVHGVVGAVLGTTDAQVVTNKDIDGGVAADTRRITLPKADSATLDGLTRKAGTLVYDTDQNKPYYDDGTDLQPWGSGSAGSASYVENSSFEEGNVDGWIKYKDADQATPVDGTGGTVTTGVDFVINSTSPMFGTYDGKFTKPASDVRGEGFSVDFTIDNYMAGKPVNIRIPTNVTSGYVSGDMGYYVYDVTNGGTPQKVGNITGSGDFVGFFIASSTSTSYRLIAHVQSESTVAFDVNVDNVDVVKQEQLLGAAITDGVSAGVLTGYGDSSNWVRGTVDNEDYYYQFVGNRCFIEWNYKQSGAGTAGSGNYAIRLPTGVTPDTSRYSASVNNSNENIIGTAHLWESALGNKDGIVYLDTVSNILRIEYGGSTIWSSSNYSFGNATLRVSISCSFYVTNHSSNTTMASRALENFYSDDGTSDILGVSGSLVPNVASSTGSTARVITLPDHYDTDFLVLELNNNGYGWSSASDLYPFLGGNNSSSSNFYGVRGYKNSATQYTFEFGNQGTFVSASNVSAGAQSWADVRASGTRFRLRDTRGGALVGYPIGARNIVGDTTGTAVPTGMIGEYLESGASATTITSMSNNTWTNVATVAVTAGIWDVDGTVDWGGSTAATAGAYLGVVVSQYSGTTTTDHVSAKNLFNTMSQGGGVYNEMTSSPTYRIRTSVATTIYLKGNCSTVGGLVSVGGHLRARRVG